MRSKSPRVSVVTPFYNTDPFLEQCLESVLSQSFEDFEYVLVDNHSTDRSREIAMSFAARDARIRVVSPPTFLGQCDNFNFALRQIADQSAYCKMVLADDWIFPDCLRDMVALGDAHPEVGLISAYCMADTELWGFGLPPSQAVFDGREVALAYLDRGVFPFGNQSTVMYRADLVRQRAQFFDDATVFFDTDAAWRILGTHKLGYVHQIHSFYRMHPGSQTDRISTFGRSNLDRMLMIENHGVGFLGTSELRDARTAVMRSVYERQGMRVLRTRTVGKDDEFWDFQRKCFAGARRSIAWHRVALGLLIVVAGLVSSPIDARRTLRERRSS
jgi:glycosyltransferase involved in cell wall biosynthesis